MTSHSIVFIAGGVAVVILLALCWATLRILLLQFFPQLPVIDPYAAALAALVLGAWIAYTISQIPAG